MSAALALQAGMAPAHDLGAEAALLAAIVLNSTALASVRDALEARHFYSRPHARMYAAALSVADSGLALDAVTLVAHLRTVGELGDVGGAGYVLDVLNSVESIKAPAAYAEVIHDHWRQREAVRFAEEMAADGREVVGGVQGWLEAQRTRLDALARGGFAREVESNDACLRRLLREMLERNRLGRSGMGLTTGIRDLDEMTLGLRGGHKYTVCALPGRGKTAFGLHLAMRAAKAGIGALFFSLEMDREEVLQRMMAAETGVDGKRIVTNKLEPHEWPKVIGAVPALGKLPIAFECDPSIHVGHVASSTRRWMDRMPAELGAPLGLVVVDYVQRLAPPPAAHGAREKHRWVAESTRALKTLAVETRLPVVELAQQKAPATPTERPGLGCVADSREVDKESSVLAFLHRHDPSDPTSTEVIIAKQRNGTTGSVFCRFDGPTQRWTERDL